MGHPTFSAVILTLNEEDHIRTCLEHLNWCDERIVVDMDSHDKTRERAQGLATKILLHELIPHFDAARNRGIEAAAGDWILVVDADEIVPPKLAERLRGQAAAAGDATGISIPIMHYCFGRALPHVGGFPEYHLRCFRRAAGGRYMGTLHTDPQLQGRTLFLPVEEGAWILHVRKNAAITDLVRKWDGYAEKEARTRLEAGEVFSGPLALLWAPLSTFRFRFFTSRGYRDGIAGLIVSVLFAFYRFEVEAKVWEAGGCGAEWDREVGRLRSPTRLLGALTSEALRRVLNRVRGRPLVVRGPGDTMPVTASSRQAPAGPPSGTDGQRG